jgi:hypothetical protein
MIPALYKRVNVITGGLLFLLLRGITTPTVTAAETTTITPRLMRIFTLFDRTIMLMLLGEI